MLLFRDPKKGWPQKMLFFSDCGLIRNKQTPLESTMIRKIEAHQWVKKKSIDYCPKKSIDFLKQKSGYPFIFSRGQIIWIFRVIKRVKNAKHRQGAPPNFPFKK